VAIAEAVALARRYASPEAGAFVNGILSAAARTRGKGR
jgi:transcription termination factor NusB